MNREAEARPSTPALIAAAGAVVIAMLVIVLDRIGVPARLLLGIVAGVGVIGFVLAALSGGTMRLPIFLTGGRSLSPIAAGLAFAIAVPSGGAWPETVATAVGLVAFALLIAPEIRRSQAISLPTFLAVRYGGKSLRFLAAVLVAGAAPVLGAQSLARAADALALATGASNSMALALCTGLMVLPLTAAGASGIARGLVTAAGLALLACLVVLAVVQVSGMLPPLVAGVTEVRGIPPARLAAILASLAALPSFAVLSASLHAPRRPWGAAFWAAIACLAIGLGTSAIPASEPSPSLLFAKVAGGILQVVAPLAAALALIGSAGVALGYDLPGHRDRLRVSTSRRFAQLRLAMIVLALTSAWLVSRFASHLPSWTDWAEAALVAGVLPAVLLTLIRPSAGPGAAGAAVLLGLGAAALASDTRVWGPAGPPASFQVVGLVIGLAVGLAVSFIAPRAKPVRPEGDAAL